MRSNRNQTVLFMTALILGSIILTAWGTRAAETADAVICTFDGDGGSAAGLVLSKTDRIVTGESILSLSYPGGVDLLVARLAHETKKEVLRFGANSSDEVAQQLARRGLIQPVVLQGRVSGQLDRDIFYDMLSTFGSTGGPLVNHRGHVIAMSEAILPNYPSFNLAVSVASMRSWLTDNSPFLISKPLSSPTF